MNLCGFVLFWGLTLAGGDWVGDLTRSGGLDLGGGVNLRVQTDLPTNSSSATPLDKYGLELDYQSLGVSVRKVPDKDVLQVGLFYKDKEQGREKKMGEALFPVVMGFKVTGLIGITLIGITIFVTKALLLSKLALALSIGLLVAKILYSEPSYEHLELDHHPSEMHSMYEYPSASGYSAMGGEYNGYANYGAYDTNEQAHEATADSSGQYQTVVAPSNASSVVPSEAGDKQAAAAKRRDMTMRTKAQLLPAYITVKKYTIEH